MDVVDDVALIAVFGVKGLVTYDLVTGHLNTARYLTFLEKLVTTIGEGEVGLFYDGLSVHKSAAT